MPEPPQVALLMWRISSSILHVKYISVKIHCVIKIPLFFLWLEISGLNYNHSKWRLGDELEVGWSGLKNEIWGIGVRYNLKVDVHGTGHIKDVYWLISLPAFIAWKSTNKLSKYTSGSRKVSVFAFFDIFPFEYRHSLCCCIYKECSQGTHEIVSILTLQKYSPKCQNNIANKTRTIVRFCLVLSVLISLKWRCINAANLH